jgi:hypothetical protein
MAEKKPEGDSGPPFEMIDGKIRELIWGSTPGEYMELRRDLERMRGRRAAAGESSGADDAVPPLEEPGGPAAEEPQFGAESSFGWAPGPRKVKLRRRSPDVHLGDTGSEKLGLRAIDELREKASQFGKVVLWPVGYTIPTPGGCFIDAVAIFEAEADARQMRAHFAAPEGQPASEAPESPATRKPYEWGLYEAAFKRS